MDGQWREGERVEEYAAHLKTDFPNSFTLRHRFFQVFWGGTGFYRIRSVTQQCAESPRWGVPEAGSENAVPQGVPRGGGGGASSLDAYTLVRNGMSGSVQWSVAL